MHSGASYTFLIPLGVVAYWCALSYVISLLAGWRRMAKSFPADHTPIGATYRWRTLRIGSSSHYGNCINVIISPEGLYMKPAALFHVGHGPVLLPWSEVKAVDESGRVEIETGGRKMSLYLPRSAAPELNRSAGRRVFG